MLWRDKSCVIALPFLGIVVPLQPQTGNEASHLRGECFLRRKREEFFERFT